MAVRRAGRGERHSRRRHGSWTADLCGMYGQPTGNSMTEALVQYVHPQPREAIAHHGTASDRHRPLLPRATCEHEDVALEGS